MPTNELFLKDNTLITSKTDLKGKITYGNKDFIHYGGYKEEEFLNKPHSLVRHPQMPKTAFKLLWDFLKEKRNFLLLYAISPKQEKPIGSLPMLHPPMMKKMKW